MIDVLILFQQVLLLVLLVIPGVILKKASLVKGDFAVGLSNVVLYVATPAMIIVSFMRKFDGRLMLRAAIVALICLLLHVFFFFVSRLLYRRAGADIQSVLRFSTVFTNAGYMGIPLIKALFGDEAVLFATFYIVFFNIFVWTLGCYIFTKDKRYISLRKAFINPATVSIAIGLICLFTSVATYLPPLPISYLSILNSLVAPLSMFIIGFGLADLKLTGFFRDFYLYEFIFVRMLLIPSACFFFLKLASLCGYNDPVAASAIFICASTPGATATSMFAEKFGGNTRYAAKLVSVSTILSVGTMPLVALWMKLL